MIAHAKDIKTLLKKDLKLLEISMVEMENSVSCTLHRSAYHAFYLCLRVLK